MLSREILQGLAQSKLDDATLLLKGRRYSSAFYLSGYAVEIGLKAAVSLQFMERVIPDKKFVNDIYTHNLRELVGLAGLTAKLAEASKNKEFAASWLVVGQWTEASRYEMVDAFRATEMVQAVGDPKAGVFEWLKQNW